MSATIIHGNDFDTQSIHTNRHQDQRKQYLIHYLVIEDWNPLVAKEDAPIKRLSLDLLICGGPTNDYEFSI